LLAAVRLSDEPPARRTILVGKPDDRRIIDGRTDALFAPGRLVAYLVERVPARALFIFRTASVHRGTTTIIGVSPDVHLLLVAATARAVRKARTALRVLVGTPDVDLDTLSDAFWLRLVDFVVARRSARIVPHVTELLRAEYAAPRRGASA
jgi:hypothetical protein